MEKLAQASWKSVDLSPSHGYILILVLQEPGLQPGQLAEQLLLSPSTITRLLEKLEEKKLIIRTVSGKTANVYPTPKAKQLSPELQKCVTDFRKQYESFLNSEESLKLVKSMNLITDKLPV